LGSFKGEESVKKEVTRLLEPAGKKIKSAKSNVPKTRKEKNSRASFAENVPSENVGGGKRPW